MADIKLTLSKDTWVHSPNIQEEARWLQQEARLFYPLNNKPVQAASGCWVYFIRDGQLVGRAKAVDFVDKASVKKMYPKSNSYMGEPAKIGPWNVLCSDMEPASKPIPHDGFQGFRYVRPSEQTQFEQAFS